MLLQAQLSCLGQPPPCYPDRFLLAGKAHLNYDRLSFSTLATLGMNSEHSLLNLRPLYADN